MGETSAEFTIDGGSTYIVVVGAADACGAAKMYMNEASRITKDTIAIFFAISFLSPSKVHLFVRQL